jgi:hypothetical protein
MKLSKSNTSLPFKIIGIKKSKKKAVPLHAMEALGGEEV